MTDDLELEQWRALWQIDVDVPSDLRATAAKHLRRMRMMLAADIAVTLVLGGGLILWAMGSGRPSVKMLAAWVWVMLFVAWTFRWFNGGGNWTGAAPNTEVFLEKLRRSYRASLRNIQFSWILGVVQLFFNWAWVYQEVSRTRQVTIWQLMTFKISLVVWVCAGLVFAWTFWLFRKLKQELGSVERLQLEWVGSEEDLDSHQGGLLSRVLEGLTEFGSGFDRWEGGVRRKAKKGWRV